MGKLIFIIGGARSGKSTFAVDLAKKFNKKTVFIATATRCDEEMKERIRQHRISRPRGWKVIEETRDVGLALSKLKSSYEVVLIDCLGLLISNLLKDGLGDSEVRKTIERLASTVIKEKHTVILVSNEVGAGIVPQNPLARRFRDLVGSCNQMMAQSADIVYVMQAGIPLKIKDLRGTKN